MNILITGGASGLGEAITRLSASDTSSTVYFTYSKSEDKAKKLEAEFPNGKAIQCDFTQQQQVESLCSRLSEFDIDVLVNNAYTGTFLQSHFQKTPAADFQLSFEQNILPTILITQSAIAVFKKKKAGKIITILTAALTNLPPVGASVYVATKAYLEALTKVWATENIKFNITSNSVSPSFMLTGLTDTLDERLIEQIRSGHPLNRLLTTTEVAESVVYLMRASSQINGVNLLINSGTNIK